MSYKCYVQMKWEQVDERAGWAHLTSPDPLLPGLKVKPFPQRTPACEGRWTRAPWAHWDSRSTALHGLPTWKTLLPQTWVRRGGNQGGPPFPYSPSSHEVGKDGSTFVLHWIMRIKVKESKYEPQRPQCLICRWCWINGPLCDFIIIF